MSCDPSERLTVLFNKESTTYATNDYLVSVVTESEQSSMQCGLGTKKRKFESSPESSKSLESSSKSPRKSIQDSPQEPGTEEEEVFDPKRKKYWRERMCEWAYQVVDHFRMSREVVSIALNYLDRYMESYGAASINKTKFQLLAMTSLYLAIKLNEYKYTIISGTSSLMETILKLSRGCYNVEQMEIMEREILQRLQWHVHPPTPQVFSKYLCSYFTSGESYEIQDLANFMIELATMDYYFVSFKPSEIALGALLNADESVVDRNCLLLPVDVAEHFDPARIAACRERLSLIYSSSTAPMDETSTVHESSCRSGSVSPVSVTAPYVG